MLKKIFILCIILTALFSITVYASTDINTEAQIEKMEDEQAQEFLNRVSIRRFATEPTPFAFEYFCANENGKIAIGVNNSNEKMICVYNDRGDFLYGYKFKCSGTFRMKWDGDNVVIYFIRSDVLVSVDSFARAQCVANIVDTTDTSSIIRREFDADKQEINGVLYEATGYNFFGANYSKVDITKDNVTKTIYDVSSQPNSQGIIIGILFVAFVIGLAVAFGVILTLIKKSTKNTGNTSSLSKDK
ncbi:MAG: hypothetical protein IJ400_05710 [Clostridia bacterium]|nr:hypothetical protein [Clostridia bacterium]